MPPAPSQSPLRPPAGASLRARVAEAIGEAARALDLSPEGPIEVLDPRDPAHGDYAANFAMVHAGAAGVPPRTLAERLAAQLAGDALFRAVEVAGPGFLNFRIEPEAIAAYVGAILAPETAPKPEPGPRLNVEFVSVNPNGPITVGSGRGAAFGDALCRVLRAAGRSVDAEFYVNDAVNSEQMRLFAESVRYYLAEAAGAPIPFPEAGYKGDYVKAAATALSAEAGPDAPVETLQSLAETRMIEAQRRDLEAFGVRFQRWFSERSLHDSGAVARAIEKLRASGAADAEPYRDETVHEDGESVLRRREEPPGPVWLRSTRFGDDKDRVLVRSDGRPAYIAGDLAYLDDKLGAREFDKSILILGPDHHGYIGRLNAVCRALGYAPERFEIVIFQIVRFVKDGRLAPMRKRDGNIYELKDLVAEVGADAARFFYLMRSHDTALDFDLDLAARQGAENPVFYAQYAHARIRSILAQAVAAGFSAAGAPQPWEPEMAALLVDPRELALIKKAIDLPAEIERIAREYSVHRLATYVLELGRLFHAFYDSCRVVDAAEPARSAARLCLVQAIGATMARALDLLGVSAPERMGPERP